MRISEAAELTGLSISNIRFYEKKGLLDPVRDPQSKYREYTPKDVYRLKQIILYRKMDIPIETIHVILENDAAPENIIKEQIEELKARQEMLQGSIDLCEEVLKHDPEKEFDIDYYLSYVKKEEESGRKFAEIEELLADFASYTQFDRFAADPFLYRFFLRPKVRMTATAVWSLAFLLMPVVFIIDILLDDHAIRPMNVLLCIFLVIILWGQFVRFYIKRPK